MLNTMTEPETLVLPGVVWRCECHPSAQWGYFAKYDSCPISDLNYGDPHSTTYGTSYPTLAELRAAHRGVRQPYSPALARAAQIATAATLRQIAQWHLATSPASEEEWFELARQVEGLEPGWACPMCQEVTCDDGCPLEPVRANHDG